jgi:hypothetical protein
MIRFECTYEKGKIQEAKFDVDDLFGLHIIAFAIELVIAIDRDDFKDLYFL